MFIFFIVFGLVRFFLLVSKEVNKQVNNKEKDSVKHKRDETVQRQDANGSKVIELSEDQYKVE